MSLEILLSFKVPFSPQVAATVQEAEPSKKAEQATGSDEASNGSGKKAFKKGKVSLP